MIGKLIINMLRLAKRLKNLKNYDITWEDYRYIFWDKMCLNCVCVCSHIYNILVEDKYVRTSKALL